METAIVLRDYQRDAIRAFEEARIGNDNRLLLTAAVGAGKTIIASSIISQEVRRGGCAIFIAHRDELIRQTVEKLAAVDPTLCVGVVRGKSNEWTDKDVVVASVQTLSQKRRLEQIPSDRFSLVVVDETHRAAAKSYQTVLEHFGCFVENGTTLLGITATAMRTDGADLGEIYQSHVFDIGMLELIERGALVPIRAVSVQTTTIITGVRKRMGDFAENELATVLNTANRNQLIAKALHENASDRKSVVFAVNVQHACDLAETLTAHGIPAEAIYGEIQPSRRRAILEDFRAGRIRALVTVQLLVEGWDEPTVDAVVWATKTLSPIKYIQGIGRGTRLSPDTGKKDLLVIDFADTCSRHSLMSLPRVLGFGNAGEEALETGEDILTAAAIDQEAKSQAKKEEAAIRGFNLHIRDVNLFGKSDALPSGAKYRWRTLIESEHYMLPLFNAQVHLRRDDEYGWRADRYDTSEGFRQFKHDVTIATGPFQHVIQRTNEHLAPIEKELLRGYQSMSRRSPSGKQVSILRGKRIARTIRSGLDAWELIAESVARSNFRIRNAA
ncbi:DEAD/DEAH box helicase [Alicyclobacillus fastidiosus]|uniref:DEAD/DEAH box helicase n=1 Tax=Alicyclobacillus fastidiosus TaxID=392011 RepID=A0ABV5AIC1_9BACL|nr:DEAD/DEAH box helicase [Alicyclobacillus fastidiosus]WEH11138.1 DEAD/DEAH box helicase [Alicyclobacillus fastidiosus]